MPQTITEVDTYTATIQAPNDTEDANVASIIDAFVKPFANRTKWLKGKLDALIAGPCGIELGIPAQTVDTDEIIASYTSTGNRWPASTGWSFTGGNIIVPSEGLYAIDAKIRGSASLDTRMSLRMNAVELDVDFNPDGKPLELRALVWINSPTSGQVITIQNGSDGSAPHALTTIPDDASGVGIARSRVRIFKVASF